MGTDQQMLNAWNSGKSPEFIAEDLGFPVHAVKAKLMTLSASYRKACGQEAEDIDELNFSREEQLMIKREMFQLAMSTENEVLKGKLLCEMRDDGKGRKDVVKQVQGGIGTMNILQLVNGSLAQAREGARAFQGNVQRGAITV